MFWKKRSGKKMEENLAKNMAWDRKRKGRRGESEGTGGNNHT